MQLIENRTIAQDVQIVLDEQGNELEALRRGVQVRVWEAAGWSPWQPRGNGTEYWLNGSLLEPDPEDPSELLAPDGRRYRLP